jgi:hypothetical protein
VGGAASAGAAGAAAAGAPAVAAALVGSAAFTVAVHKKVNRPNTPRAPELPRASKDRCDVMCELRSTVRSVSWGRNAEMERC